MYSSSETRRCIIISRLPHNLGAPAIQLPPFFSGRAMYEASFTYHHFTTATITLSVPFIYPIAPVILYLSCIPHHQEELY